jgi:acyl carrier protein
VGIEKDIVDRLKPDVPLFKQGLDSIDLAMLAFAAEKKFGVNLSQVDPGVLRTIDTIVVFLNQSMR